MGPFDTLGGEIVVDLGTDWVSLEEVIESLQFSSSPNEVRPVVGQDGSRFSSSCHETPEEGDEGIGRHV